MSDKFTPEKELIERIRVGDQSAFKAIFYRYKDKLFSYCLRFTKSEAIAEEIVQDVLLKIWTERERINPDLSFSSYLYTITRNKALNFLKKAAGDAALKEKLFHYFDKQHCRSEDQLRYNELTHITEEAVALLPPRRRMIYEMSRKQAMNYEEIADELGISRYTVKNQLIKALGFIRNYLNTHAEIGICLFYAFFMIAAVLG